MCVCVKLCCARARERCTGNSIVLRPPWQLDACITTAPHRVPAPIPQRWLAGISNLGFSVSPPPPPSLPPPPPQPRPSAKQIQIHGHVPQLFHDRHLVSTLNDPNTPTRTRGRSRLRRGQSSSRPSRRLTTAKQLCRISVAENIQMLRCHVEAIRAPSKTLNFAAMHLIQTLPVHVMFPQRPK